MAIKKKIKTKTILRGVGKRAIVIFPALLFSGVAFAKEGIDTCENVRHSAELATQVAEAAKRAATIKKMRSTTSLAAGTVAICNKAIKENANKDPKTQAGLFLILICGFIGGWTANNFKNGGGL